jgi:hypothetical protein
MKDGLVLMYVKDNTIYPVALTQEQLYTFEMIQQLLPQPLRVISDKPLGKAVNLVKEKN